jgi:hypothetical protein
MQYTLKSKYRTAGMASVNAQLSGETCPYMTAPPVRLVKLPLAHLIIMDPIIDNGIVSVFNHALKVQMLEGNNV